MSGCRNSGVETLGGGASKAMWLPNTGLVGIGTPVISHPVPPPQPLSHGPLVIQDNWPAVSQAWQLPSSRDTLTNIVSTHPAL